MRVGLLVAGLAVAGCGRGRGARESPPAVAPEDPWRERSDAELDAEIAAATARARGNGKQVLLEFVAPWCVDCREMTRVEAEPPAREVLARRYERVRVNVGDGFSRHRALLMRHGINRIAAYVVLDPASGVTVAQTTVEPVSTGRAVTSAEWARWLEAPR